MIAITFKRADDETYSGDIDMMQWNRATSWWRDEHIITEGDVTDLATYNHIKLLTNHPEKVIRLIACAAHQDTNIPDETLQLIRQMPELDIQRRDLTRDFGYLLIGPRPVRAIRMLQDNRVFDWMAPDVAEMAKMSDRGHKNIWEHTMTVMDNGRLLSTEVFDAACVFEDVMGWDACRGINLITLRMRLALLLHDIGKTVTRSYGKTRCESCHGITDVRDLDAPQCQRCGKELHPPRNFFKLNRSKVTFKYHEVKSRPIVQRVMQDHFNFPSPLTEWVRDDCALHGATKRGTFDEIIRQGCKLSENDSLTPNPKLPIERLVEKLRGDSDPVIGDVNEAVRWQVIASDASVHTEEQKERIRTLQSMAREIRTRRREEARRIESRTPLIDGNELQEIFSIPAGRWIGEAHRRMIEDKLADPEEHTRARAIEIAEEVISEMSE